MALINAHIPFVRGVVTVNAYINIFMTNDVWLRCSRFFGIFGESKTSTNVVGVTVCVHQVTDRGFAPCTNGVNNGNSASCTRCVEAHQSISGVPHHAVAEAFNDCQVVGQLSDVVGDPVQWLINDSRINDFGGKFNWVHDCTLFQRRTYFLAEGSLGSPSTRSPRILRITFEVPPMMV